MGMRMGVPAMPDAALADVLLRAIGGMTHGITLAENSPGRPFVYANNAFVRLTGYPLHEILGRSSSLLQSPNETDVASAAISEAMDNGCDITAVLTAYRRDNSTFTTELSISAVRGGSGEITHFIGTHVDVTGRIERERELTRLAQTDALTGLTNQRQVMLQLDELLAEAAGQDLAVIVMNLSHFHHINEDFDFETGDHVLAGIAGRLRSLASADDIVGRLTADRFVMVRRGSATCEIAAQRLVAEIRGVLQAPIETPEIAIPIRVNCGIAVAPQDGDTAKSLIEVALARADVYPPAHHVRR